MNKSRITQPLKWPGGKYYMAREIISLMPKHIHFCSPFLGGAAVELVRDPLDLSLSLDGKGVSEVWNDIDGVLMNFWQVLANEDLFKQLHRRCSLTPFSRKMFDNSFEYISNYEKDDDDYRGIVPKVDLAFAFFVVARQSRSGMMKDFTSITRTRTRRGMNGNVSEWLGSIEGLPEVHERLSSVLLESMDALELIQREDTENTLFYCDPPYWPEAVSTTGLYKYGMNKEKHEDMIEVLMCCKGKIMLSGYKNDFYVRILEGNNWKRHDFHKPNQLSGSKIKDIRTECLWTNF